MLVENEKRCLRPGDGFKDCPECPEMVLVGHRDVRQRIDAVAGA